MRAKMLRYGVLTFFLIFGQVDSLSRAAEVEKKLLRGAVLPLQDALVRGIQKNLDLQVVKFRIPINKENVTIDGAQFDPVVDAHNLFTGAKGH